MGAGRGLAGGSGKPRGDGTFALDVPALSPVFTCQNIASRMFLFHTRNMELMV